MFRVGRLSDQHSKTYNSPAVFSLPLHPKRMPPFPAAPPAAVLPPVFQAGRKRLMTDPQPSVGYWSGETGSE